MTYDPNNIFALILKGDIPCDKIYEDEFALAFHDINPQAPVHALVIPKGPYVSLDDFTANAPDALIVGYLRAINKVAAALNIQEAGYRALSNIGQNAHQEVPHLHIHLFGGKALGPMLSQ